MNKKIVQNIIHYAKKLAENSLIGENNSISLRIDDDNMLITKSDAKFNNLDNKDIIAVNINNYNDIPKNCKKNVVRHANIYKERKDVNCIMQTAPKNSMTVAKTGVTIPPVLDDMAQIVGPTARTAKSNEVYYIIKALRNRSACLLKGEGMISTGRTLDEAYTACLVLEKAAHTFIMATAVGGCKPVGRFGAWIEHFVYRKKYSKANQDEKLLAERE